MSRERIIVEIETLGQALKVEQTIRTGYCEPIAENILQWIAAEEDLSNSYQKIAEKSVFREIKKDLIGLEEESHNNIALLHSILQSIEQFSAARSRREELIERLMQRT
jgi:hypothetical protein